MQDTTFQIHKDIEQRHWWFLGRLRILESVIVELMRGQETDLIVDVGCGTGGTVSTLSKTFRCLGVDNSELAIQMAEESYPESRFVRGVSPMVLRPLAEETALYLLMDVLEYIDDDRGFLEGIVEAARPGAFILITVPACRALWSGHDVAADHKRRYEWTELEKLVAGLDADPVFMTYFTSRLYPLIWSVRQIVKRLGRTAGRHGTDFFLPAPPLNCDRLVTLTSTV